MMHPPPEHRSPEHLPGMAGRFFERAVLLDADRSLLFGPPEPLPPGLALREINTGGRTVGFVGLAPPKILADALQLRFLERQKKALLLIALLVTAMAAGLSFPLANGMVRRVGALTVATHRLASGRFDTRIAADAGDELGQLARDFNALALTLEKNESARKQWVADISHELRTPLALLRGELEAVQDGVRPLGLATVQHLHGDVMRLERLVNDLYELSLSDLGALNYRKTEVSLARVLEAAVEQFREAFTEESITLHCTPASFPPAPVFADPERLHQLFVNLLENALRYTEAGGRCDVRLETEGDMAIAHFLDSPPGVPNEDLHRLFERLYRREGSRNRSAGGAGLGLAICRNIVEAHDGSVTAKPSPHGGVWIEVKLPLGA